jgi:Universal stress protein family
VHQARAADLLVVGSRGHGILRGLLLGSVARQCAMRATCPVLVVHPETARTSGRSASVAGITGGLIRRPARTAAPCWLPAAIAHRTALAG